MPQSSAIHRACRRVRSARQGLLRGSALAALWSVCFACLPGAPASAAPQVGAVRNLTPRVSRYGRFELAAPITGAWTNPFDPEQADVWAEFTSPSGRNLRVPAFWHQGYAESPPATPVRRQMDTVSLFAYDRDWATGTRCEFFIDDVSLIDRQGREQPYDDMELGAEPRQEALHAPPLTWSTTVRRSGKRSLLFAPTFEGQTRWPTVLFRLGGKDWTGYRGMALWVYPRCETPIGPLRIYYTDKVWGKSRDGAWEPRAGALKPNQWNRLEWRWVDPWAPVSLTATGAPEWRARFTPTEVGRYQGRLTARDPEGATASEPFVFDVAPSTSHGFVRVSKQDPHYFAFDDGAPFVPIGHDVPLGLPDVRACYPRMKAHGENATYFILCPYDLSFEWNQLGVYDLERAARIDRVIEAAEQNGIYMKLSFDVHDALRPSSWWGTNPYNAARGGPCANPNDYFTDPTAWQYYAKRARYLAARWGYSPNIMAWEPVAELDGATFFGGYEGWGYPTRAGGDKVSVMLAGFLQKLAGRLRQFDPYGRMFTTSYGGDTSDERHWRLPEVAYTQIHCYDSADPSETLSRWARDLTRRYAKPMMITEFGPGIEGPAPGIDPLAINLHNGIWASLLGGSAGCALNWHWWYVHDWGLYCHYSPLRRFATGIDWPREQFRPAQVTTQVPDLRRMIEVETAVQTRGGFGDVTVTDYRIRPDGTPSGTAVPPAFTLARGRSEKRVSPRFTTSFPRPSRFVVDVREVCPDARLTITLDGRTVRTIELPARSVPGKLSWKDPTHGIWVCRYDQSYSIEVPAGRHVIQVENSHPGTSWVQVRAYRFVRREPAGLRVIGLAGRRSVLLWVLNRESVWERWREPAPAAISGATLVLRGLTPGRRRVEWLDPWSGKVVRTEAATPRRGILKVEAPPIKRDLACRVLR